MALSYSPRIVTDGLVLCLDAADKNSYPGTGTTWSDVSGNDNNGTLTNGPTFNSENGGSIVFDGSNDYVNGVHNSQLDITGNLSVECWFRVTANRSDYVRVFGKGNSTNRTYGLWYLQGSSGQFLYQKINGANTMNVLHSATVALNTWYHIMGTTNSNLHTLYINSIPVLSTTQTITGPSLTDPYTLGYGNVHTYHIGNISNCRLYNRALTATEIQQNYNATKSRYGL
jgi:hypothetical protein